jgi:hypothetical protein
MLQVRDASLAILENQTVADIAGTDQEQIYFI